MANLKPEALAYFARRWGYNIGPNATFDEVNNYLKTDTRTVGRRQYLNLYYKFVTLLEDVLDKEGSFRNIAPDFIENRWDILMGGRVDTIARAKLRDLLLFSDELRKKYPDLPEFKNHLIGTPYPSRVQRDEGETLVDDVFRGEAETVVPEVHDPLDGPEVDGPEEYEDEEADDEDDEENEDDDMDEDDEEDGDEYEEGEEMSTEADNTPPQQPPQSPAAAQTAAQTPPPNTPLVIGSITPSTAGPQGTQKRPYVRKTPTPGAPASGAPGAPVEAGADPLDFLGSTTGPRPVVRRVDPAGSSFLTGHRIRVYREPSFPGEQEAFQGEYPSEQVASFGHGKGAVSIFLQQVVMRTYPPRPGDIQINYRIARVAPNGVEQAYTESLRLGVGVYASTSQTGQAQNTQMMPPQQFGGHVQQPIQPHDPLENFRKAQEQVREMEAEVEERQRASDEAAEERAQQLAAAQQRNDNSTLEVLKQAQDRERQMMERHYSALEAARGAAEKARLDAEKAKMDARLAALEAPPPPPVVMPQPSNGGERQLLSVLGGLVERLVTGGSNTQAHAAPQLSLLDIAKLQTDAEDRRAKMQAEADERAERRFQQMLTFMKPQGESPEMTAMRIQLVKMEARLEQAAQAAKAPSDTSSLLSATKALGELGLKVGPGGSESLLSVAKAFFENSAALGEFASRFGWAKPAEASGQAQPAQAGSSAQAQQRPTPRAPSFIQNRAVDPAVRAAQEERDRKVRSSLPPSISGSIDAMLNETEEVNIPQRVTDLFVALNEYADLTETDNKARVTRGEAPIQNFMDQISKQLEELIRTGNVVGTNQYLRSVLTNLGYQQLATPAKIRKIVDIIMVLVRSQPVLPGPSEEEPGVEPPAPASPPAQAAQPQPQAQPTPAPAPQQKAAASQPPAAPEAPKAKVVTPAMRGKPLEVPR